MASKLTKPSLIKNVSKRGYAAAAAAAQKLVNPYALPEKEHQVTKLDNGLVVATMEHNKPVSQLSFLVKAGSRNETIGNAGVSHVLRRSTGLATAEMSQIGIVRFCQQLGAELTTEGGREHTAYTMQMLRDKVSHGVEVINEILQPAFRPWELETLTPYLKQDVALVTDATRAVELLHKVAFRDGLGNSIFLPERNLYSIDADCLNDFISCTHSLANSAIIGMGVDHDALVEFARKKLVAPTDEAIAVRAQKHFGGEFRVETGSALSNVAVCGKGAAIGGKDHTALAIAQYALGGGSTVKYGSNSSSKLSALAGENAAVNTINVNYSDSGLFGYVVIAEAYAVGDAVTAVHKAIKSTTLSDKEVAAGKAKLKSALYMAGEHSTNQAEEFGLQVLFTGKYLKPADAAAAIDSCSTSAVNAAVKSVFSGPLSLAAVGGLQTTPYLDEL